MITAVLLGMMCAFMVGAVVGNEADARAYEKEQVDLAEADDFISALRGTSPALFGDLTVDLRLDASDFIAKVGALGNQDAAA